MTVILENDWDSMLEEEFNKPYYMDLMEFLNKEYTCTQVFPVKEDIFNAIQYTKYDDVKVVILGQDPYHGPDQAHGLSFSVKKGVSIPPSLKNIYKELNSDLGCTIPNHGCLEKWTRQGVLLLNSILTVREGEAHSHRKKGWEMFTDKIISLLNEREDPVIFLLWGKPAQEKAKLIDKGRHYILTSPHPSPLSAHRGFFGSQPFSKVNHILQEIGKEEIDWQIT